MKKFVAVYLGSPEAMERSGWNAMSAEERKQREAQGIAAWQQWARDNQASIVDGGAPLGRTKKASPHGVEDTKNAIAAYVIVQAPSHEAAARLFHGHPHFTIFPGDSVEIMECLPVPGA